MFFDLFDRTATILQRRFSRLYFAPTALALATSLLTVWLATGHPAGTAVERFNGLEAGIQVLAVGGFLGTSVGIGLVLSANAVTIIRMFEGYAGPARWLRRLGCRYHAARREEHIREDKPLYFQYSPTPQSVMPTRFGNILRAAEDYPRLRYGLDAFYVWPRLYRVLPQELVTDLGAAREAIDGALTISVVSGGVAIGGAVTLPLAHSTTPALFCAVVLPALLVAALAYSSAGGAAAVYGETIRVAFDLHRHTLLERLGLEVPRLDSEERKLWQEVIDTWVSSGSPPRPR